MMIDTALRAQKMCEEYVSGVSSPELGRRYGITRERVRQILEPFGVIKKRRSQRRQEIADHEMKMASKRAEYERRKQQAVQMVSDGASIAKAAKSFKISIAVVAKAMKEAGVQTKHGRWRNLGNAKQRAMELVKEGKTGPQIAQILTAEGMAVSDAWVYRNFADPIRSERERRHPRAANDNLALRIAA